MFLDRRFVEAASGKVTQWPRREALLAFAHLGGSGQDEAWPVPVVAESPDDFSVVFRTYCSQWPVDGRRHVRSPILAPGPVHLSDVVSRYLAALDAGDAEAIVNAFVPDGYVREPIGPSPTHRAPLVLHRAIHRGRHRPAALGGHRRRCAMRPGIQLHPLGR